MIFGIGTDLCDITRIERMLKQRGDVFIRKILTPKEEERASKPLKASWLAKRFAAKEAIVKAMGTGFVDGLWFSDVEVLNNAAGKPYVILSAKAQALLPQGAEVFLSLSDEKAYAMAFAVIEQK